MRYCKRFAVRSSVCVFGVCPKKKFVLSIRIERGVGDMKMGVGRSLEKKPQKFRKSSNFLKISKLKNLKNL